MPSVTMIGDFLHLNAGILCHQVNCKGRMGAGLALEIRNKYPKVYKDYMAAYNAGHLKLGNVVMTEIKPKLFMASICGQFDWGYATNRQYTDYAAVSEGFEKVQKFADDNKVDPIYVPYLMGCGLGGGDWHMVLQCIYMFMPNTILVQKL